VTDHYFQERLDFAMKEIIFDLLSVGKKSNFQSPEVSTTESIINVIVLE